MQTTGAPSTIKLKSRFGRLDERKANAALSPGHLLRMNSSGKVLKHDLVGGFAERMFALEDALRGKGVTDAYATDDPVQVGLFLPGDLVLGRIGTGQDIAFGDLLISAGDGTLKKCAAADGKVVYANVAESAEHENTTTAADFNVTHVIPANSLQAGDVLHIHGNVTVNDNNGTDTLQLLLKLNSTTLFDTGAVDVADLDIGFFDAYVIIRTVGASGTFVASGLGGLGVPGTVTGKAFHVASTAIDTTAAATVAINADWSVAHADNEVSLTGLIVELLRQGHYVGMAEQAVDNDPGTAEAFLKTRLF